MLGTHVFADNPGTSGEPILLAEGASSSSFSLCPPVFLDFFSVVGVQHALCTLF